MGRGVEIFGDLNEILDDWKDFEGREERGGKEKKFLFLSNVSRLKFEIFYNFQSTRLKDKRFPIA